MRTVTRWLDRLGLNRIRGITPDGENLRRPGKVTARFRGWSPAISTWVHHCTYHRPHTACADQPPASRVHAGVDNVMTTYN